MLRTMDGFTENFGNWHKPRQHAGVFLSETSYKTKTLHNQVCSVFGVAVIGYARVSTREQNPQSQAAELRADGAEQIFTDRGESSREAARGREELRTDRQDPWCQRSKHLPCNFGRKSLNHNDNQCYI